MAKYFFDRFPAIEYYNNNVLRNIILKSRIVQEVFDHFDSFYPYVIEDWERPDTIAADYYGDSKYYWIVLMSNNIVDPMYQWPLGHYDFIRYMEKKYNKTIDETKAHILHYRFRDIGGNVKDWIYTRPPSEQSDLLFEYDTLINARKDWKLPPETFEYFDKTLQGTLDLNNSNGVIITGSNTIFEVELEKGQDIYINVGNSLYVQRTVKDIISNTEMIISNNVIEANNAASYKLYYEPLGLTDRFSAEGWEPVYAYDYELELNDAKRSIRLLDNRYTGQIERELSIALATQL
jgi:hypothetical protein